MYNLKIISCGDRKELYIINNYLIKESKKAEGYKMIDKLLERIDQKDSNEISEEELNEPSNKQSKQDRIKTLTNARNNIIRLIKCNSDIKTFITLTFAKEQDYKQSKTSLNIFFTLLRKRYKQLKYLWVLEYGDTNKRLHYHLLCNIPIYIRLSKSTEKKTIEHKQLEKEFAEKYWKYGFVDIRHLGKEQNSNIALYVATYIVKSLENLELHGYRVYGYSRNLNRPQIEKIYTTEKIEDILRQYGDYKVVYSNSYQIGYADYRGNHSGNVTYFDMNKIKESVNK